MDANKRMQVQANAMMPATWKILILGVCSLALGINSISCSNNLAAEQLSSAHMNPTSVSYPQNYALAQTTREFRQQYQQQQQQQPSEQIAGYYPLRSQSAAGAIAAAASAHQPGIYHSIIDGSNDGPSTAISASPAVQSSTATTAGDLNTAAGHHHGHAYGKYYEYRAVPKKNTWKFGYKRGNHKHTISRHEHGKAGKHPHFKTKVKWHDSKSKGKGIHLWDYNHHDKKHYGHHG